MNKKLISWVLLGVVAMVFTGCTSVQNYSLRSYQGPLPLEDYRYINTEAYGVPTGLR